MEAVQSFVGKYVFRHPFNDAGWRGGHICADPGGLWHVVGGADRGGGNLRCDAVAGVDPRGLGTRLGAAGAPAVGPSDERQDEVRARFRRQQGLTGRESVRDVDHAAFVSRVLQALGRAKASGALIAMLPATFACSRMASFSAVSAERFTATSCRLALAVGAVITQARGDGETPRR